MDIKKRVGKRIKELRKARKLSQAQLSEKIDIAQNTLSYIETGDNFFTSETLEKLIVALNIEPQELFMFERSETYSPLLEEINAMLKDKPEKINLAYKIIKEIYNDCA